MLDLILVAPRSVSSDIESASVLVSSSTCFQSKSSLLEASHPTSSSRPCSLSPFASIRHTSRFQGTYEVAFRSPENLIASSKTSVSTRGLEELLDDPSAPLLLRRACQSPPVRPFVPPVFWLRLECFDAPKSSSTPRDSAFEPASFACVGLPLPHAPDPAKSTNARSELHKSPKSFLHLFLLAPWLN
jgi:hypothetical protein